MFAYYLQLGLRSLKRNPVLTILMILTLAIGVAASVSTLTILHMMGSDPIPHKSQKLVYVGLDNGDLDGYVAGKKPSDHQLSWQDVQNLLSAPVGLRRVGLYGVRASVESGRSDLGSFSESGVAANRDFFAAFDTPFLYGQAWQAQQDQQAADVVVLNQDLAEKLFGKTNPVGKTVRMFDQEFAVVGVLNNWQPRPRFHSYNGRSMALTSKDAFFIPLNTASRHEVTHNGGMSCHGPKVEPGWQGRLKSECTWLHFWIELNSAAERQQVSTYLNNYVKEQGKLGRLKRQAPVQLYNVNEFLVERKLVGDDSKLSAWLAFGFLLLCLVNTIGILLAKFSVRAAEVGVRRALGASKLQIFAQFIIESAVVGLVGAMLGLLLTLGALALLALRSKAIAAVAQLDLQMVLAAVLLSILSAILAGLLPTWRACQVTPALQLKAQ